MIGRERERTFRWDFSSGVATTVAALLCLVPLVGWLAAWHMRVDLQSWLRFAVLPALLALGALELWLVRRHPVLFNRLSTGLIGGVVAVAMLDLVRLPFVVLYKGAPDWVPMIGQHLTRETIGIAPSQLAGMLGYGYHWLLIGALLGAAYALTIGKGRWYWGMLTGGALALGFMALPQARLLTVATGYDPMVAGAIWLAAFMVAGAALGLVVQRLGRTTANVLYVVFLREEPVEAPELAGLRR